MSKQFELDFTGGGGGKRCMQLYVLPEASCPKGNLQITISEDGASYVGRVMGAFIIESVDQALKTLLTVTGSDSSRDDIRLLRGFTSTGNTLSLASLTGNFLAISVFCTSGDEPFSSDGDVIDTLPEATSRGALVSTKEGSDEAIGFTVSSDTAGGVEHLVFAEYEKE